MKKTLIVIIVTVPVLLVLTVFGSKKGSGATQGAVTATPSSNARSITLSEIQQHAKQSDCWLAISGSVYNITSFIPSHPGGEIIVQACGKDATSLFSGDQAMHMHSGRADAELARLKIGILAQ